jgi:hypothetical protein
MRKRIWIRSGIEEVLDARQQRLLDLVHGQIVHYYQALHQTRPCYQYPLSLSRLMRLCRRNSYAVLSAVRILANSIELGGDREPLIFYDRITSEKNAAHRPYRIFLRDRN